jgi:hypothetical protein
MRTPALVIGILLLIVGGLISAGVLSFDKTETVAKLGPLEVQSTQQKKPAPVIGYVLLGAGALLLVVGFTAKK